MVNPSTRAYLCLGAIGFAVLSFVVTCPALAQSTTAPATATAGEVAQAQELIDSWSGQGDRLQRAKAILDRVLAEDPRNVEAMKQQARLTMSSGYINNLPRLYQGHKYSVGNYRSGTLEKAEAILLDALRIKPGFADGYVLLGYVYVQQEKPQEAAAALRKAEELGTKDPWLHLNWASLHESRGESAAARERWQRVLSEGTSNERAMASAYGFLIEHLRKEGKHEEALALFRKQVARYPDDAWGHGGLASYLQSLGRYEEAIVEGRTALRIMNYGIGRRNLAVSLYSRWGELLEAGKRPQAQPFFDEAYAIEPNLDRIMWLVAQEGRAEGLIRALAKEKNISVDARDTDGSTGLLVAVNKNNPTAVKLLLGMGANPNFRDRNGWTPLLSAADEGNEENVRMLLAAGADRKATMQGRTPDVVAELNGYGKLAREIREYSASK